MNLVYTAIYGGFDTLRQPKYVTEGWEYKCYTDTPLEEKIWKIITRERGELSPVKMSKYIKIMHPMESYENILWVDGSIEILGDLNKFIALLPQGDIIVAEHPCNKSIDKELKACIALKKDDESIMKAQVERYKDMKPYIHTQNGILLRRKDMQASEIWWNEVKNGSKRDQLSFAWSMQQANQEYSVYQWSLIKGYFKWYPKHVGQ